MCQLALCHHCPAGEAEYGTSFWGGTWELGSPEELCVDLSSCPHASVDTEWTKRPIQEGSVECKNHGTQYTGGGVGRAVIMWAGHELSVRSTLGLSIE